MIHIFFILLVGKKLKEFLIVEKICENGTANKIFFSKVIFGVCKNNYSKFSKKKKKAMYLHGSVHTFLFFLVSVGLNKQE